MANGDPRVLPNAESTVAATQGGTYLSRRQKGNLSHSKTGGQSSFQPHHDRLLHPAAILNHSLQLLPFPILFTLQPHLTRFRTTQMPLSNVTASSLPSLCLA